MAIDTDELQRQIDDVRVMAEDALDKFPIRSTTTPGAGKERHIHDLGKHPGGVIAARVHNSANISLSNSTVTTLTFDSERFDTDTIHSTSTNTGRLTTKTAGKYLISATVQFATNTTGKRTLRLRVNGSTPIADTAITASGDSRDVTITTLWDLAADDYVELQALQDSGGALNVEAESNSSPEFMMARIGAAGTSGGGAPGTDHGALSGLGDDDHALYLLAGGSREGSTGGAQSFGSTGISADVIAEDTPGAGVTVADVLLRQGDVTVADGNSLKLATDGSTGTLILGATGDVKLFRGAANLLQMAAGDSFTVVAGGAIQRLQSDGDANPTAELSGVALKFGAGGASAVDVTLGRGAANRLDLASGDSFRILAGNATLADGVMFIKEQADADADQGGFGQIWVNTASPNELFFTDDAGNDVQLTPRKFSYSITVEDPTSSEDITIAFTNRAITITEMRAVLIGSSTPSVTWTIKHHATDRNNAGNAVVTASTTTTSVTTGDDVTAFNDATIPADSYIWLETSAKSGTVTEIHITIIGSED